MPTHEPCLITDTGTGGRWGPIKKYGTLIPKLQGMHVNGDLNSIAVRLRSFHRQEFRTHHKPSLSRSSVQYTITFSATIAIMLSWSSVQPVRVSTAAANWRGHSHSQFEACLNHKIFGQRLPVSSVLFHHCIVHVAGNRSKLLGREPLRG